MIIDFITDIHFSLAKNPEWETSRFLQLFKHLKHTDSEIIILGGDIFNKKPTIQELKVFYEALAITEKRTIIIDGNHEAITLDSYVYDFIPKVGFEYVKDEVLSFFNDTVHLHLVGHSGIANLPKPTLSGKNYLFSHLRCTIPPFIKEEVPLEKIADGYDFVYLGDIHSACYSPYDNVVYAGQPYTSKFVRSETNGYLELTITPEGISHEHKELDLPCKIKYNIQVDNLTTLNDMMYDRHLYKVIVSGTADELSTVGKAPKNSIYELSVITEDIDSHDFDIFNSSKLDVFGALLTITKDEYKLDEATFDIGKEIVDTYRVQGDT